MSVYLYCIQRDEIDAPASSFIVPLRKTRDTAGPEKATVHYILHKNIDEDESVFTDGDESFFKNRPNSSAEYEDGNRIVIQSR